MAPGNVAGDLRIGTAGWAVPQRYAPDFPEPGSHLMRYARGLSCVEIDTSFYRPHQRKTYERWAAATPDGFRFAVKLPKTITHEHKLTQCEALLDDFLAGVTGLGPKLSTLLVQLPPRLDFNAAVAQRFFTGLCARSAAAIACEPRHATWFTPEAEALLTELQVIRVAADPRPAPGADQPGGTLEAIYYRMHGSPNMYYSDYEPHLLADLSAAILAHRRRGASVWCIFDNTAAYAALGNARDLARLCADQRN